MNLKYYILNFNKIVLQSFVCIEENIKKFKKTQ